MSDAVAEASVAELASEVARLREQVADAQRLAQRAEDRGQVENLFNRYMYLHNAFQDEQIIPLWVKEGTEGIRARYTNAGQYTTWESVTRYHRGRPTPEGKLILHATTTPAYAAAFEAAARRRRQDGEGRVAHGRHRVGPHRPQGRRGVP